MLKRIKHGFEVRITSEQFKELKNYQESLYVENLINPLLAVSKTTSKVILVISNTRLSTFLKDKNCDPQLQAIFKNVTIVSPDTVELLINHIV